MQLSHETIYRYIYSIEDKECRIALINCLRQSRKRRKPRRKDGFKRSAIRNLVSIHERPNTAKDREEPGHWEGDLIIGKNHKSAIGTLVERTTRFTIIVSFLGTPNAIATTHAFAAALGVLPSHMKKSLTYDRGTEMAAHQRFTELTGIPVYFADPYSPWQRGTNENTNGLIRDYLPKGTDFREIDDEQLITIESALNSRPRKTLEYHTPEQLFNWLNQRVESTVEGFYIHCYPFVV
jgi:transposase, IS30 family